MKEIRESIGRLEESTEGIMEAMERLASLNVQVDPLEVIRKVRHATCLLLEPAHSRLVFERDTMLKELDSLDNLPKPKEPLPCSQCSVEDREHAGQQCWDQPCAELHDWISNQLPPYSSDSSEE